MSIKTIKSQLNNELIFLVNCCKTSPNEEDTAFIHSYLNHPHLDSNALVGLVNQHGVLPLVYKTIRALSAIDAHYETIVNELKVHYQTITQRNMLMSAELIRIMKLLEENGIEALAFKGPVLSQMAYGDITLRQYGDLDVLVDEDKISKAGSALEKHGYSPVFPLHILKNKTCLEVTNDLGFYNQTNGILIELHWKLFREKIGQHLHFVQMSENKQSVKINGKSISTLSTEMLLVYLCLHGSKHAWERVEWICDIDRLIDSHKEINWDKVLTIAQEMDTSTALCLGLKLSSALLHTSLPEHIMLMVENERIENLMAKTYTMLNSTLDDNGGYSRYQSIHMYQMDLLDTKLKKLKHLSATYLGISRNDCQSFPLPSALKFLYIFIKPFRVMMKYIQYGR